jgi:antitoxin MazE
MEVAVVKIGNSKGIRLSKTLIDKYKIKDKVEISLEEEHITIKAKPEPRKNWDQAFKMMHKNGDDKILIDDVFDNEKFEEWS